VIVWVVLTAIFWGNLFRFYPSMIDGVYDGTSEASVVGRLARDKNIAIAGPVLTQSNRLTDHDLVEIARHQSQAHLLAISGRSSLNTSVTDVLIERGNADVTCKMAANAGARFSEIGFVKVVHVARGNEALAIALASRSDVPDELQPFLQLASA